MRTRAKDRMVFRATRAIPGIANQGDEIAVYVDGRGYPVISYSQHRKSALTTLFENRAALELLVRPESHESSLPISIRRLLGPTLVN